jgi:hypothetical protein
MENQSKEYVTVEISGIITSIAETTDIKGYTVDIIQTVMPEGIEELTIKEWINQNNLRMKAICAMLNIWKV